MLQLISVTKYFGGLAAVDNLHLNINQGEMVGLIGPNGAGKTTLFNLITGFLRLTRGEVLFERENISNKKPHAIADKGIVRTFQASSLFFDFNVFQNIIAACHINPKAGFWESLFHTSAYHSKESRIQERALDLLHFVGLEEAKDLPAQTLPHGHKRILGIAIAMAPNPKLLLLDEPLCGMNAEEVDRTKRLIKKAWQNGITILLIEHNMRAIMSLCQRIVVLNFGKKIAEGAPEEIRRNETVVQAYLGDGSYAASS
ncbi:MAG: ABC transporter ATP-binding protein [Desulfobacteraceae bacterium]|jgi:branched-chain amino acid transport system ATP-binding protein